MFPLRSPAAGLRVATLLEKWGILLKVKHMSILLIPEQLSILLTVTHLSILLIDKHLSIIELVKHLVIMNGFETIQCVPFSPASGRGKG